MNNSVPAFCGVDCGACKDLALGRCPGCRQTEWEEGDECMPVACCKARGIVYCAACDVFPCDSMKEFYEESEGHREAYRRMLALHG